MIDSKLIRTQAKYVQQQLKLRGVDFPYDQYESLENKRKDLQLKTETLQQQRNDKAREIGKAKAQGQDADELMNKAKVLNDQLGQYAEDLKQSNEAIHLLLSELPNLADDSVPVGDNEDQNVEVSRNGMPPSFGFEPADHIHLAEQKGWLPTHISSEVSGARFAYMRGDLAKLHRCLAQFMLNLHTTAHGYEEINTPVIVNGKALYGTGQLPKFAEDVFKIDRPGYDQDSYLIPTSEVTLTNLVNNQIIDIEALPLRFTAHSLCFRSEAGSSGRDTRGLIRQHQFEKVELVQIAHPQHSMAALEEMRSHAETVLQQLEIPYRVIELCTGDLGFCSAKTYDLEVWVPTQNTYREISSISNCQSFQARRMKARYRNPETHKTDFVHTLNGSGVAVGRAMVALLENNQTENGDIKIPKVLQAAMGTELI